MVPRLRGLRDPGRLPELRPRARHPPGRHGVRHRDRVQWPVRVLHEHVRHPQHPRAGPGARHRRGHRQPQALGVDRDRRRRCALHRREPPHPRSAPQREPQDPDVQQPDLRAHQGPVLADQRGGQGHQVHAVRLARPPVQPGRPGPGGRGDVRGPVDRRGPAAPDRGPPGGVAPRRDGVRRGLPELQRVQRRRLRSPSPARMARPATRSGSSTASRSRSGRTGSGAWRSSSTARSAWPRPRTRRPSSSTCTTRTTRTRRRRSAWPTCRTAPPRPPRSASSGTSSGPCTDRPWTCRSSAPPSAWGRATSSPCSTPATPGPSG